MRYRPVRNRPRVTISHLDLNTPTVAGQPIDTRGRLMNAACHDFAFGACHGVLCFSSTDRRPELQLRRSHRQSPLPQLICSRDRIAQAEPVTSSLMALRGNSTRRSNAMRGNDFTARITDDCNIEDRLARWASALDTEISCRGQV